MGNPTFLVTRWRGRAFVLLLLICTSSRAADELVFAVARLPLSLPVYVAQAQGYFAT